MSMARNYVQEGDVLDHTAGGIAIPSGAVVVMGKRVGIALADIPALTTGSASVTGVWNLPKVEAEVFAQGDELYWDDAADRLTKTAADNVMAGYAAAPAGAGVATVNIKING
jgi:predicted RecA/RadA family phage recombinase